MKMTAFTDSEYTYLHELDLDGIKEMQTVAIKQENDTVTHVNVEYCVSVAKQVPALIAEVERLREEVERAKPVYVDIAVLQEGYERFESENDALREKLALYDGLTLRSVYLEGENKALLDVNAHLREKLNNESETLQRFERQLRLFISDNSTLRLALQQIQNSDAWFIDDDINEEDAYLRCVEIADKALGGEPDE